MNIRFQTPYQYVFIHQGIKHLLLLWKKERKREIYIIEEEKEKEMILRYPGETYSDLILQELEPLFFQRLEVDGRTFLAVLGATFTHQQRTMAMYYDPDHPAESLFFFEYSGEKIFEIDENEYQEVVQTFMREFPEYFTEPPDR